MSKGSKLGLESGDNMKKAHVEAFKSYLINEKSLLTGIQLEDKTVKDILGGFRKVLICYGKEHMLDETYKSMGLAVSHGDLERPIDFGPNYIAERADYQQKLENCRNGSYAVQSQLGAAFGLREAERVESRDTIVFDDGQLLVTKGASVKQHAVTERYIAKYYGESAVKRLKTVYNNPGEQHLIAENAKGNRTRFIPVDNVTRQAAVERLQKFIQESPGHQVFRKSYLDGRTLKQAEENYAKIQERYGATRDNQLSSHCDRHFEAQRLYQECLDEGMTDKEAAREVVDQMGHADPRKVRYYVQVK